MGKDHLEKFLTAKIKPRYDIQLGLFEYLILRVGKRRFEIHINQKMGIDIHEKTQDKTSDMRS